MADLKVALEELKEESDSGAMVSAPAAAAPRGRKRMGLWVGVAILVVVLASFAGWRFASGLKPAASKATVYQPVPLTSYAGNQADPSFSPDGSQIAFDWDGPNQDNTDIYVKVVGPGPPLRLTMDPAVDERPKWSPDGRSIAFLRMAPDSGGYSVMLIPALGGPERRLGTFANTEPGATRPIESMCWTPDSKALVISAAESVGLPNRLVLVPLDGGPPRVLTHPDEPGSGDAFPAISSDGRVLAFMRGNSSNTHPMQVPVSASVELQGDPHAVSLKETFISDLEWLPDSPDLLFVSGGRTNNSLLRYSMETGVEEPPMAGLGSVNSIAVSSKGRRLAYSAGRDDSNIWKVDLKTKTAELDGGLSSSFRDVFPQFSPDGKRVAFYSRRTGLLQIWLANADGSQAEAITSMPGPTTGSPRWSPNGQQIVFDSNTGGEYHVYVIGAGGGQPRQVTQGTAFGGNWSRDGRWIYYAANTSGPEQIWKMPAGGGTAVQMTHGGGTGAQESPDGKTLYFVRQNGSGGIWKIPVEGGEETQVVKSTVYRVNFVVTDKGIYFTPQNRSDGVSSLQFFNFVTGISTQIIKLTKFLDLGLTVSPDGRTLLYCQFDQSGSNLMLVENFR